MATTQRKEMFMVDKNGKIVPIDSINAILNKPTTQAQQPFIGPPAPPIGPRLNPDIPIRTQETSGGSSAASTVRYAPQTVRTEDGGFQTSSIQSPLADFQKRQSFMEFVKQAIQKRQGMNKDIQAGKDYWRTQQRDMSTFADKDFQLMSPTEQANVRASRSAAASAHLQGLSEEEAFREGRLSDTLKALTDAATAEDNFRKSIQDEQNNVLARENARLGNLKLQKDLGYNVDASDVFGSVVSADGQRVYDKQGGSINWRTNNPGNIMFANQAGAVPGPYTRNGDGSKGIQLAVFPTMEDGYEAMKQLLKTPGYTMKTLEGALRRWSGGGYGAEVVPGIGANTKMSEIVKYPELLEKVVEGIINGEGGIKEGKILTIDNGTPTIEVTPATKSTFMKDYNLTSEDVRGWSEDFWREKMGLARDNTIQMAVEDAEIALEAKRKPESIRASLQREYGDLLTSADLDSVMYEVGFTKDILGNWITTNV